MSVDDAGQSQSGGAERRVDLASLFRTFLGEGGGQDSGSADLGGLGSLLGAFLGQGAPEAPSAGQTDAGIAGLVEGLGLSPAVAQAAIALVLGSLLQGGSAQGSKGGVAGLMAQAGDRPLDEEAVKATGLPEQLSKETGLDLPKAIQTVQQILQWLRKATKPLGSASASKPSGSTTTAAKKRRRKSSSQKKKTSSSAAKPRRPKSSSNTAKPKRPKTSSSATKPKKTSGSTRPTARRKSGTRSESAEAE
jgi:hypothetical protein